MTDFVEIAVSAAQLGGRILRENLAKAVTVGYKGEGNLVTNVDRQSEEAIVTLLRTSFPDHEILAEEGGGGAPRSPYRWLIDPLDGTTNYAHHFPFFCVSVGLEREGIPLVGVVYDPIREELFVGEQGKGAFLNGNPISVSSTQYLGQSLLVTGFSYDVRVSPLNNFDHFFTFSLKAQGVRRTGSAALDLCYVAAGRFDGFWELKLHPWDTAAGSLIVLEAGGEVTDFEGTPFSASFKEIVASNGMIHHEMLTLLQKSKQE